ncbi:MAG: hypothetical protein K6G22_14035 [Lachnospiraceae bacterium]|nr:hypothetical protein [Lachnospiraceae bacterium]
MIYLISLALFILFFVMSFIAGYVIFIKTRHMDKSFVTLYCQGMTLIIVIFAICSTLCSFFHASVRFAAALWLCVILLLELVFVFRDTRLFPVFLKELWTDTKKRLKNGPLTTALGLIVFSALIFQILFLTSHTFYDTSLINGIKEATRAYETGSIEISSPLMMLYASLSILLKIHPLTLIFSIWPFVILPVYHGFEWSLSGRLFKDDMNLRLFMMLIFNLFQIFGYYCMETAGGTMLLSYYRGSAFLLYAVLPMGLWFVIRFNDRIRDRIKDRIKESFEYTEFTDEEEEDMKNHKLVNARTVGILLLVFIVVTAGLIFVLNRKINNLHNALVGYQSAKENAISVSEFGEKEGSDLMIIEKRDGLILIGGADESENEELLKYLLESDKEVKEWYIRQGMEKDRISLDLCKENDVKVDKVYSIQEASGE